MTTVEDILDKLYHSASSEREKGDNFERMMLQYLKTDLTYSQLFSEVWMWMDWPGRDGRPDTGIDLVALERATGEYVAIQCKFYDPEATIYKSNIDSFLAESGKHPFSRRMVATTTNNWGPNVKKGIEDQQIPVTLFGLTDLLDSRVDWAAFNPATPEVMTLTGRKELRPHQKEALTNVLDGLEVADRGKLIMACGSGKTYTSLKIMEEMVPLGGTVAFMVPSIALLSQTLREWTNEAEGDGTMTVFAVCSDTKVGKQAAKRDEDMSAAELTVPVTTDPQKLAELMASSRSSDTRTVVFSTYQSIDVLAQAQKLGGADFDLIVCDEAHRTTGATLHGSDESAFTRVHDQEYLRTAKRLYMTATPRIYDDASKAKAGEAQALLASMDDEDLYGKELHRLGFGEAVSRGLLTDYRVLILAVDEAGVSGDFQDLLATNSELNLPDVAKIVGAWNGLAKRGQSEHGFETDPLPMRRAVAFAQDIKTSKKFAELFEQVIDDYITDNPQTTADEEAGKPLLKAEVRHVDGTDHILKRNQELDWLKTQPEPNQVRILSNARCLSEGVDVPDLDAVMFLNPRRSVVDVVQSVGRVMRLAPGKKYGYIILPVAVPSNTSPDDALRDNKSFKVVWDVLQALRAHDERFDAMVNQIDLNKNRDARVDTNFIGGSKGPSTPGADDGGATDAADGAAALDEAQIAVQGVLNFGPIGDLRDAIYARLVTKVGNRRYWEDWAKDVAAISDRHRSRLLTLIKDPTVARAFEDFLTALRRNLNDGITAEGAVDMLSQHLITKPVFDALFEGHAFSQSNSVSNVMQTMLETLEGANLEAETESLEGFYESVRTRAAGIDNAEGKQRIITELYERFFKLAFPRAADALGIVYTPVQVVDFIIRSVDHLLKEHFGQGITGENVHVMDPFTGTGTFIVRLLQSGLIKPEDLVRKYASELHANEIMLLAYYIAVINIETTFHDLMAKNSGEADYMPFEGAVLTDTFQMSEDGDLNDNDVFRRNNARIEAQKALDIRVIVGNPPYSVGQTSENDNNANLKYPDLDLAIENTYVQRSSAVSHRTLYDSYIRALRWASTRIGDAGVIGFVTNGGFLDANSADGLRKTLTSEFTSIYIYNMRGNMRSSNWKSEGGQVFGPGSQTTVVVTFLVKEPDHEGTPVVHYHNIGDYLTREEKFERVDTATIQDLPWEAITPNESGDWINQRSDHFTTHSPLGDRRGPGAVFRVYSGGLGTSRDAWVYNYSRQRVEVNAERMTEYYNTQVERFQTVVAEQGLRITPLSIKQFIDTDATKISWSSSLTASLGRGKEGRFDADAVVDAAYRPFMRQRVYFDDLLNHRRGILPSAFPTASHPNYGFYISGTGATKPFSVQAVSAVPDLNYWGSEGGQFFARYTYAALDDGLLALDEQGGLDGYQRVDNITDEALTEYRETYGEAVSKDDIFNYIYGLLHSEHYLAEFEADLKKMLPHIPKVAPEHFSAFVNVGTELMDLHLNYEDAEPYDLHVDGPLETDDPYVYYRVEKLRWKAGTDKKVMVYNSDMTITGFPDQTHDYMLAGRSALDWIINRYQVKTHTASQIVNDPNDWSREVGNPRYILDLIGKVTTVSVETVRIVNSLPKVDFSA